MVAADPRNDSVLYLVAPGGGVWKTSDGGSSWIPLTELISSLQVCSIAIDSHSPDVLYIGTGDDQSPRPSQTVARSVDGGRSWTLQARFTNQPVCALAVDPTNSSRVFAGSAEGLFVSQDAGGRWNKVIASPVTSIAFDSKGIAYAGMLGEDLAGAREHVLTRSSDGGNTWTDIPLPESPYPSTSQTTWVNVTTGADSVSVIVLYQPVPFLQGSPSSAQSPLSLVDFYRSTDGGSTWSTRVRAGEARPPTQLLLDSGSGNLYLAGNTLMASANQGTSWFTITTTTGDFHSAVFTGGMLLLGGEKGLELNPLSPTATPRMIQQLPLGQFLGVSLDSQNGVWAAGLPGLFGPISSVSGAVGNVTAMANSSDIFAAGNKEIRTSTDGGVHFSSSTVIAEGELRAQYPPLVVDPVNTSSAYVAATRLYHTTNAGQSWTALPVVDSDATHVVIALAMSPAQRTTLYVASACLPELVLISCRTTTSLIWRSANGGQSWSQMGSVSGYVNRLAVDPRQNNTVYAAIGAFPGGPSLSAGYIRGDLQQSTNGGSTWTSIRTNLPNVPVNAVVIDPTSLPPLTFNAPTPGQFPIPGQPFGPIRFIVNQPAQTLYVATDAGVFVTFNLGGGGNTAPTPQWTDISWGLPLTPVTDITLRQPDGILTAATFGRGVYSVSVKGLAAGVVATSLSIDVTLMKGTTLTAGVPLVNVSTANTLGWRLNAYDPWMSIPEANGTMRPLSSAQSAFRISAAGLEPGTYLGRLQLVSGPFLQTIFVTAHVTAAPAQLTIASGNNAFGVVRTALPPLQVFVSDGNQNPLAGIPVDFTIIAGGGSVGARTVFTNTAGIAGTVVTLPSNAGIVQLLATSGALSVTFTVTAVDAPALLADSVVDGVTFNSFAFPAPGSILSITGQNLAQTTVLVSTATLPTMLEATRVLLVTATDAMALPLLSISPTQINAFLPTDLSPGVYGLRVEASSLRSNVIQISVATFAPGIFTQNGSGRGLGIFIKDDGSVVTAANPADRGARVTFLATGLGAVDPPVAAGQPGAGAEPFNRTIEAPRVFFDTYSAEVLYSGLLPDTAARYQVTVLVPPLLSPATNISVSLTIGGFASNRVTIPVR